jgi:hypothetical protein
MIGPVYLPFLSVWQCLTQPRAVVAEVRAYCTRIEQRIADYARHEYLLQEANERLRASLAEAEAENRALRAARNTVGYFFRGGDA